MNTTAFQSVLERSAPPDRPWVAIVGNPFSGHGKNNQASVDRLIDALERKGLATWVVWDRVKRKTMLQEPGMLSACRCVVVAGGDGTVADVVNEMSPVGNNGHAAPNAVPLAVMPLGNENLLAKHFGFVHGPERIAEAIAAGRDAVIDVGIARAEGKPARKFTLMLSIGLDAEVVHRVAAWRTATTDGSVRRVSHLSYVRPIFKSLCGYDYPRFTLEADGQTVTGALALVFNLPRYGMNLPFAYDADGSDGKLDWVVFHRPGLLRSIDYLQSVARKKHRKRGDVSFGRAEHITVRPLDPQHPSPMQADGDAAGHTPVEVMAQRDALRVIVGR